MSQATSPKVYLDYGVSRRDAVDNRPLRPVFRYAYQDPFLGIPRIGGDRHISRAAALTAIIYRVLHETGATPRVVNTVEALYEREKGQSVAA